MNPTWLENRLQRIIILSGITLVLYYVAVYRPLSRQADSLNEPLAVAFQKLVLASTADRSLVSLEPARINANLRQAQVELVAVREAEQRMLARTALEPAVQAKVKEPFQLIDYLNARQQKIEQLERVAKQQQVALKPEVLARLPEYASDEAHSSLLWVQLFATEQLLTAAIQTKINTIESVQWLPIRSYEPGNEGQGALEEVPIKVTLEGSMSLVSQWLLSLPLHPHEIKGLGLPAPPATKPALFISRILIRKKAPEKNDMVQLELTASGFVRR